MVPAMPRKLAPPQAPTPPKTPKPPTSRARSSALLDTRIIDCGDNPEQLATLPEDCSDHWQIGDGSTRDSNSNRKHVNFSGTSAEKHTFEDRHTSTRAYIDHMRPRCIELPRMFVTARVVELSK